MKNLSFLLASVVLYSTINGMLPSKPVTIQKTPSEIERRSLLKSRSPGDCSVLEQRKETKDESQNTKLTPKILEFISKEAPLVIKDVIRQELSDNCQLGDVKLDLALQLHLIDLKIKSLQLTSVPDVNPEPNEDPETYKIRSNPVARNKIDQRIFELALSLNEAYRTRHSNN